MNLLDVILIIVVATSLIFGFRRGFILGAYEIVAAIVGLVVASQLYLRVADSLEFLNLEQGWRNLIAFIIVYAVTQIPAMMIIGPAVRWFRSLTGIMPGVSLADRVAGLAPGLLRGLLIASVITIFIGFFPTTTRAGSLLDSSRVGLWLYRASTSATLRAADATGFKIADLYSVTPRAEGSKYVLPFKVDNDDLTVDIAAEQHLLDLVNAERTQRGLGPLLLDQELSVVARAHAREMFREGYFAHISPSTGTPFDRLQAAGISYGLAGENLAFAPDVDRAHQGLMDSPGHRANILQSGFHKVGIAAISSNRHGTMVVELFTD